MQLNINIDQDIFKQAKILSGLQNETDLLQCALQVLIEQSTQKCVIPITQIESIV